MRTRIVAVVAAALLPVQTEAQSLQERFELFSGCQPMDLIVEGLPSDATEIGLTEQRIQTTAESRLRAARLFSDDTIPYLYINVAVVGRAFSWSVTYNKFVHDEAIDQRGMANTWRSGGTGTHGGDAGYILQSLSESLDRFVLEYLRINEDACDQ